MVYPKMRLEEKNGLLIIINTGCNNKSCVDKAYVTLSAGLFMSYSISSCPVKIMKELLFICIMLICTFCIYAQHTLRLSIKKSEDKTPLQNG